MGKLFGTDGIRGVVNAGLDADLAYKVGLAAAEVLAKGKQPACVEVCPARVRYFGDFDDPDSEVSKLIREREYMQLLPEKGTKPSVYYLV